MDGDIRNLWRSTQRLAERRVAAVRLGPAWRRSWTAGGRPSSASCLTPAECEALAGLYPDEAHFRSHVRMARHGFGQGEYRYFRYPLPELVAGLQDRALSAPRRRSPMPGASGCASGRSIRRRMRSSSPACHAAGQTRPTPLLLQYGPGDYNCLHQDLYGALAFPLQVAVLLSRPGRDFTGGEFVLTEQRPRMQTRAEVVPLGQGDGVAFAVAGRPVAGSRGDYRVTMRHGVSRLRSGRRHTVGLIFHDAN